MNNTVLAEQQSNTTDFPQWSETQYEPSYQRLSVRSRQSSQRSRQGRQKDWITVPVVLACSIAFFLIGAVYVGAFAKIAWQSQRITTINAELATANAQHETLVKQVALLQSDHRISRLAQQLNMTQAGSNTLIDVMPDQPIGRREIASAQ